MKRCYIARRQRLGGRSATLIGHIFEFQIVRFCQRGLADMRSEPGGGPAEINRLLEACLRKSSMLLIPDLSGLTRIDTASEITMHTGSQLSALYLVRRI